MKASFVLYPLSCQTRPSPTFCLRLGEGGKGNSGKAARFLRQESRLEKGGNGGNENGRPQYFLSPPHPLTERGGKGGLWNWGLHHPHTLFATPPLSSSYTLPARI